MVRKSASRVKPIKVDNPIEEHELPPIEETFENAKQMFVATAEVALVISGRIDNMDNVRNAVYVFWGNEFNDRCMPKERVKYIKKMTALTTEVYKSLIEVIKGFELEEFLKEEMKDYFEPIMPKIEDIESEQDLFEAKLAFEIIKPWGEKTAALHQQMLQEAKAREL